MRAVAAQSRRVKDGPVPISSLVRTVACSTSILRVSSRSRPSFRPGSNAFARSRRAASAPGIELTRLDPVLITQVGDGDLLQELLPNNRALLLCAEIAPALPSCHVDLLSGSCIQP